MQGWRTLRTQGRPNGSCRRSDPRRGIDPASREFKPEALMLVVGRGVAVVCRDLDVAERMLRHGMRDQAPGAVQCGP